MSLWVPYSAVLNWIVILGLPSLKYIVTEIVVSKQVVISDRCVFQVLVYFCESTECDCQTAKANKLDMYAGIQTWTIKPSLHVSTHAGEEGGGMLIDDRASLYSIESQNVLYYCPLCVY